MASSSSSTLLLLSPLPLSDLSYKPLRPHYPHFLLPHCHERHRRRRRLLTRAKKGRGGGDSAEPPDRIISAVCYLYPFLDGVHFGRFLLAQFPPIQLIIFPFAPAIRLFSASPLNPFLIFLTLYFAVVRNPSSFSRYVRYNTMQAIVLDVLLIFPDLIERFFAPRDGVGLDIVMSIDSTVFLFLLISMIYGSTTCLLGQVPRLPIVADAADRQSKQSITSLKASNLWRLCSKSKEVGGYGWVQHLKSHHGWAGVGEACLHRVWIPNGYPTKIPCRALQTNHILSNWLIS